MEESRFLTRKDLEFITTTLSLPKKVYLTEEEIENLLESELLFRRVMNEEEILLYISPYLFFRILLKRAHRELRWEAYTIERFGNQKVFVFDTDRVSELLERKDIRTYLAQMLGSFTKIESTVFYLVAENRVYKFKYSNFNIEDIEERLNLVDEEKRFPLLRKIGDLSLFLLGIFPEYVNRYISFHRKQKDLTEKMQKLEEKGSFYYYLASIHEEAKREGLSNTLYTLSQNFPLLKKPLNFIAERYLQFKKSRIFKL